MTPIATPALFAVLLTVPVLLPLATVVRAADLLPPICDLGIHEATRELEEARLAVDLARSRFEAFEEIFELIDGLWKADAIDRMTWLRARYDRDAGRLDLERADLVLERQRALLEEYRLVCESAAAGESPETRRKIDEAYDRYRRADCDQQAKAVEVAEVDLEFERQWLAGIRELRQEEVATRPQVIRAEMEVELAEKRLADSRRRTQACRRELGIAADPPAN